MIVRLLSCGQQKHARPLPARRLYCGEMTRKMVKLAERDEGVVPWWFVSGPYGLLDPDTVVAPYDDAVFHWPKPRRVRWGAEVALALSRRVDLAGATVELWMGRRYADVLRPPLVALGARHAPTMLDGLEVGERLRELNRLLGV